MCKIQRIPLEERLRSAGSPKGTLPATAWLYIDGCCKNFSEMSMDQSYIEFYEDALVNGTYGDIHNIFVAQAACEAISGIYPPQAASELLYHILVKPFADKNIFNTCR